MVQSKSYQVVSGDTIDTIARKNGLAGWQAVYYAKCNLQFRKRNPDPHRISPGQIINIPLNKMELIASLNDRLRTYRELVQELTLMKAAEEQSILASRRSVKNWADGVDLASDMIQLAWGLGALTASGYKASKASGKQLAAINDDVLKGLVKDKGKTALELAAKTTEGSLNVSDSTTKNALKAIAKSIVDTLAPSFWAQVYINLNEGMTWSNAVADSDPTRAIDNALLQHRAMSEKFLNGLRIKISELQAELVKLQMA